METVLYNPPFSHIYVEGSARGYPLTKQVLSAFPNARQIEINHYKDVFCQKQHNFAAQKKSPSLILSKNGGRGLYKGSELCDSFGNEHFYYVNHMLNCLYDCEYCYLQGMLPSAAVVIFVNPKAIYGEVTELLKKHSMYVCVSYDTDLLAFEHITGFLSDWLEMTRTHEDLEIEIRTKSAAYNAIRRFRPVSNVVISWTVSPREITNRREHGAPGLTNRISSINAALSDGWRVRICIDPILYVENWQEHYMDLIVELQREIDLSAVHEFSIGTFRMPEAFLKKSIRLRPCSEIFSYPSFSHGKYSDADRKELIDFVYHELLIRDAPNIKIRPGEL
ncbi:MAG: radical SAM protein [Clostridiales bacterium]|jgi:spore photoproduct lyase|nr:radical SAM protein [Clostridiales bacterium]